MTFHNLPDVEFCTIDADTIEKNAVKTFEGITGRTLAPGNPERLFLSALISLIVQQRNIINASGKMNLLSYASNAFLDHLGLMTNTPRLAEQTAVTTLKYAVDTALDFAVPIARGSRATSEDGSIVFETTAYAEIPAGDTHVDVAAQCTVPGSVGNDYLSGQISRMVDVVPYITAVSNITPTAGGADVEGADAYRVRIHQSPSKFSVAGPGAAYEYWAKTAHQDIIDLAVFRDDPLAGLNEAQLESVLTVLGIDHTAMNVADKRTRVANELSPSRVNIYPLMKNGTLPDTEILGRVTDILNQNNVRPLTDQVRVAAPEPVAYDLECTYYIASEDIPAIASIQANVAVAVEEYLLWQRSKIKRDINPDRLVQLVKNAGAKRLEIISPVFQTLIGGQIAMENSVSINYGGAENE